MLYDLLEPTPNKFLSKTSLALIPKGDDPDLSRFEAQGELAEMLLGFEDIPLMTGADADKAARFIALQMNWQVEVGMDPLYIKSISSDHSSQLKVYRDGIAIIYPLIAKGISNFVKSKRYNRYIRSLRR